MMVFPDKKLEDYLFCEACNKKLTFKQDEVYNNDVAARCECGAIYVWRNGHMLRIMELKSGGN